MKTSSARGESLQIFFPHHPHFLSNNPLPKSCHGYHSRSLPYTNMSMVGVMVGSLLDPHLMRSVLNQTSHISCWGPVQNENTGVLVKKQKQKQKTKKGKGNFLLLWPILLILSLNLSRSFCICYSKTSWRDNWRVKAAPIAHPLLAWAPAGAEGRGAREWTAENAPQSDGTAQEKSPRFQHMLHYSIPLKQRQKSKIKIMTNFKMASPEH